MADDRIAKLSERFSRHQAGRKPAAPRNRERRSLYLDGALLERIDQEHRAVNYALYPKSVNKAAFLETLIEYGLEHLDELKAVLDRSADGEQPRNNR
ncbi:MAG: hypothetical protein M3Q10_18525 [Chloroflexota bacterium]|nr:hypothetical protein [Chloroflexota bacterium]